MESVQRFDPVSFQFLQFLECFGIGFVNDLNRQVVYRMILKVPAEVDCFFLQNMLDLWWLIHVLSCEVVSPTYGTHD